MLNPNKISPLRHQVFSFLLWRKSILIAKQIIKYEKFNRIESSRISKTFVQRFTPLWRETIWDFNSIPLKGICQKPNHNTNLKKKIRVESNNKLVCPPLKTCKKKNINIPPNLNLDRRLLKNFKLDKYKTGQLPNLLEANGSTVSVHSVFKGWGHQKSRPLS